MNAPHASSLITARLTLRRADFTLDVDLVLPGRGVTALFGPSGCGKTTCLRALAGLERAQPGHVHVNGVAWQDDAQGLWLPTHQRALGYVFQEPSLFEHLSVHRNVLYGQKRTPAARRTVALEHAVELLGIGHLLQRMPQTLSGGERQRVAIARALASSPCALLMDEPLAALDAARKAEVLPYLERLHRTLDIPVIYVSHALDEVLQLADTMVLLEAGQVRAQGPIATVLSRLDAPLHPGLHPSTVIETTVLAYDPHDCITTVAFDDQHLLLISATPHTPGTRLRVCIAAQHVHVLHTASSPATGQLLHSALNQLPATIAALSPHSAGQTLISLAMGHHTVLACIATRRVHAMALAPGLKVLAQIPVYAATV